MNILSKSSPVVIGYDASATVGARSGIGRYAAELLTAMAEAAPEGWRFRALVNSPRLPLPDDPWTRAANVELRMRRIPGKALLTGWRLARAPRFEALAGRIDLLHSPASYDIPRAPGVPFVVTVHDLFFLDPRAPSEPWGGDYFRRTFPRALPRADRVIVPSRATGDEAARVYGLDPARVVVIPEGVDHERFRPEPRDGGSHGGWRREGDPRDGGRHDGGRRDGEPRGAEAERVARLTGGPGPYLLAIGAPSPRKNYVMLVEAFARAFPEPAARPRLVIVGGRGFAEGEAALAWTIDRLAMGPWVRRPGYVSAEDLPALYRGALALVYPSLYEGFGLPILEAMASGAPVLTTDVGAAPEVAGGAALLTAPRVEAIAAAVARLATDAALREKLMEEGLARAREFSWSRAAQRTLEVYAEVIEEARRGRRKG